MLGRLVTSRTDHNLDLCNLMASRKVGFLAAIDLTENHVPVTVFIWVAEYNIPRWSDFALVDLLVHR